MKKIAYTILGLFFLCSAIAQNIKPRFSSVNSIGFAIGESTPGLVSETINGIKFSNWFSGIGIGIDNYHYKTLPLFIDGRWFFGDDKSGFIYGDIGYNFPMKNKPGKEIYYYDSYHFTGGVYTDIGIGFKTKFIKESSLLLSLGHSYKKLQTKIGVNICPFIGPCYVDYSKYDFRFGRMILKAGLVF
ncbi:MAG: hypothetical protein ABIR03_08305 [Ginsengibacter sp.]